MPGMTIRHASAMPAPTWSWLKMNDVEYAVEMNNLIKLEMEGAIG